MSPGESHLTTEDCPRCGCWMAAPINCNCGQLHGDCCANCGRYTAPTLTRDEYIELSEFDERCSFGQVEHEHVVHPAKIEIKPDDGGPVDQEHVFAVSGVVGFGAKFLAEVQARLRKCKRPATARELFDA